MTLYPEQQSILPIYDTFQHPPPVTMAARGRPPKAGAPSSAAMLSPVAAAWQMTRPRSAAAGLGQSGGSGPLDYVIALAVLGVAGWLSYEAGKAMAPPGSEPSTWGWVGVPLGIFTGPFGLGIMGAVSNRRD